jgi:hypothetical protein
MNPEIHVVNHQHHYLPTCPCVECRKKRSGQVGPSFSSFPSKRLIAVPPKVAYLLGLIPGLQPEGSLARSLKE